MTRIELVSSPDFYLHHTAVERGYVSRKPEKSPDPVGYAGIFGRGYKLYHPRFDSSRYCYVDYYIERPV